MKKLMIVIQETGEHNGKGYNVTLEGDTERLNATPNDQLSPAEFWGKKLFQVCVQVLKDVGAVDNIKPKH